MASPTLCIVALHYPATAADPDSYLAREAVFIDIPSALAQRGYAVHVVHLFPVDAHFIREEVTYHFIRSGPISRSLSNGFSKITGRSRVAYEPAWRAIQQVKTIQPDLIHFHGTNLYLNHALLRQALKPVPPTVVQYHGGHPSPHRVMRTVQRKNLQASSRYLFTTREHALPFVEADLLASDRVVEFMQVSSTFHRQSRPEARAVTHMEGDPVFLWTGRLHPIKDPMTVLQGFEQILQHWPEAHFYCYYLTDELLPDLQAFVVTRPGLKDHVHFRGTALLAEMEAIYNSADFLIQGSHREFSGRAVLEAMACGVIPIVTDIPSFRAMTDQGRLGTLFPVGNTEALVKGVLAIDPKTIPEQSRQIRTRFEQSLSYPALAEQLDKIYREMLAVA